MICNLDLVPRSSGYFLAMESLDRLQLDHISLEAMLGIILYPLDPNSLGAWMNLIPTVLEPLSLGALPDQILCLLHLLS